MIIDRNIELGVYEVNPLLNCNFQSEEFCHWYVDKSRCSDSWVFNKDVDGGYTESQAYFKSREPNFKTGPQNGDRYGSKCNINPTYDIKY